MVLPEPAAHDAHAQAVGWIDEIVVSLGLSAHGSLVLVDQAHPSRLGDLVRTLRHQWPEIDIHTDVQDILHLPPGSMFVLVPRAEDADWLNMRRQVFADERFKVVLWCDEAAAAALKWKAPDFYDWIARRQVCPKGPPPFAVSGLRAAFQAKWPVVWTGSDSNEAVEEVIHAVAPAENVSWIEGSEPYERVLERMADPAVVAVRIGSPRQLRRARWAFAEAKRSSRVILVAPGLECPGFWPLDTSFEGLAAAREALAGAGAKAPGRLAALLDLEPFAIGYARSLLLDSIAERDIEQAIAEQLDPMAGLLPLRRVEAVMISLTKGFNYQIPTWQEHLKHSILLWEVPALHRNFATRPEARDAFDKWMAHFAERRYLSDDVVGIWAAHASSRFKGSWGIAFGAAYAPEPVLRAGRDAVIPQVTLAVVAASLGEHHVALHWLLPVRNRYPLNLLKNLVRRVFEKKDAAELLTDLFELAGKLDQLTRRSATLLTVCLWLLMGSLFVSFSEAYGLLLLVATLTMGFFAVFTRYAFRGQQPAMGFLRDVKSDVARIQLEIEKVTVLLSKNPRDADVELDAVLRDAKFTLGEDHPFYEKAVCTWASVLLAHGYSRRALELVSPLLSPDREVSAELALLTAGILASSGRAGDAVQVLARLTGAAMSQKSLLLPTAPANLSGEDPPLDRLVQCPEGALAQNPQAHLALIEALLKQGRYPEAVLVARKAVTRFANDTSPVADKLRARLADLERRMGSASGGAPA